MSEQPAARAAKENSLAAEGKLSQWETEFCSDLLTKADVDDLTLNQREKLTEIYEKHCK